MKTFSNRTMKPAPLKQHLANAHPSMISKNRNFFELKLSNVKRQKLNRTVSTTSPGIEKFVAKKTRQPLH